MNIVGFAGARRQNHKYCVDTQIASKNETINRAPAQTSRRLAGLRLQAGLSLV